MPDPRTTSAARRAHTGTGTRSARRPRGDRRQRRDVVPSTRVMLVRHARTPTTGRVLPGRARGLDLSDDGRAQADGVAAKIASLPKLPVAVYSSPLERTKQTARPIAGALGVPLHLSAGLIECDVGEWTGQELRRLFRTPEWANVQRWPAGFRFPGGESFTEMSARATATVLDLVARHPGETVVAVSHADVIRAVIASAAGIHLDLFQRLVVSPCSISVLHYDQGGPRILCVNATASLAELVVS